MRFLLIIISICIVAFSCELKKNSKQKIKKDSRMVLINTSDFTRREIAILIQKITSCNPAVIGLTDVFDNTSTQQEDSALASSLSRSGKVILSVDLSEQGSLIRSDPKLTTAAKEQGVVSYFENSEEVIESFVPLYENEEGQILNISFELYFAYAPKKAAALFEKINVNQHYLINYSTYRNSFMELDSNAISCESIKDKIVIFGYIGPADEGSALTPMDKINGTRTHMPFIIANVLSNFLDEDHLVSVD
jgi:CHASE2 domain-containing sensor protein